MSDEDAQKALDVSYARFGDAGVDLGAAISRVDKMLDCLDVRTRCTPCSVTGHRGLSSEFTVWVFPIPPLLHDDRGLIY